MNNKVYKLEIPQYIKNAGLIPIFYLWKLHLAPNNLFPGQILLPKPLTLIQDDNDNMHNKKEILNIINYCKTKKNMIQYKATYIDNWKEWNVALAWQPWTEFENAKVKISEFHRQYLKKPMVPPELTSSNKYDLETMH